MGKQQTLFDSAPEPKNHYGYARKTDPETSKQAIDQDAVLDARSQFLRGLKSLGRPSTANEIARNGAERRMIETVRKRAKELVKSGHVREAGKRKCIFTGKSATTYELVR